jgi:hypothetical protein
MINQKIRRKRQANALIEKRKEIDKLFKEGKITKNKRGRLMTQIKYYWNVWYNENPDIPDSVKQAYNLLWEGKI